VSISLVPYRPSLPRETWPFPPPGQRRCDLRLLPPARRAGSLYRLVVWGMLYREKASRPVLACALSSRPLSAWASDRQIALSTVDSVRRWALVGPCSSFRYGAADVGSEPTFSKCASSRPAGSHSLLPPSPPLAFPPFRPTWPFDSLSDRSDAPVFFLMPDRSLGPLLGTGAAQAAWHTIRLELSLLLLAHAVAAAEGMPPYSGDSLGLLYLEVDKRKKLCVPSSCRDEILKLVHEHPMEGAHSGIERTLSRLAYRFYWKKLRKDVESFVSTCDPCQKNKPRRTKPPGQLHSLRIP
jgi:hypothetical protein